MKILVTGAAGFLGSAVCSRLLAQGEKVLGVDAYADDPFALKASRLKLLSAHAGFELERIDIREAQLLRSAFARFKPQCVVHFAARTNARQSVVAPADYVDVNIGGFARVLESCEHTGVEHLLFASSSSVYGNGSVPFREDARVDAPVSLYGATKASNELLARSVSLTNGLRTTAVRFFTVYGPWGRPDMAPFLFTEALLKGKPLDVFAEGRLRRDWTFVDDAVEAVSRLLFMPADHPFRIFNVASGKPLSVLEAIALLEELTGRKALRRALPMQAGDVQETWADVQALESAVGYRPTTPLQEGLSRLVSWYREWSKGTG